LDQQPPVSASLYDRDALAWAERQADLLRQLADGENLQAEIDWTNVIEEIRDVGMSELRACSSFLNQAMVHLLKVRAWPDSPASALWREEIYRFLDDAEDRFSPSMRQRIDIDALYAKACHRALRGTDVSGSARPLPDHCPFTLDDLLAADVPALLAQIG
jgi:hypothetical protein